MTTRLSGQPHQEQRRELLEFEFGSEKTFDCVMLQENFRNGQRVEEFVVEVWKNDGWEEIIKGTTIGYKRLIRFSPVKTNKVKLIIISSTGKS